MNKIIQTIMVVPISETIGKAFGRNTLLGTGAAIVTARFVLRSFSGMLALGALAGGLNYLQRQQSGADDGKPASAKHRTKHRRDHADGVAGD